MAGATGIKCRTTTCGVAVDRVLTVSVSGEGAEIFDYVVLIVVGKVGEGVTTVIAVGSVDTTKLWVV